jgi:hypothetical protein
MLVEQSFHIFNRYGKNEDSLNTITRVFLDDLQRFSEDEITEAFKEWRKINEGMPTPAGIIKLIEKRKNPEKTRYKTFAEFNGDWPAYKRYLKSIGMLNPKLSA